MQWVYYYYLLEHFPQNFGMPHTDELNHLV